MQSPLYGTWSFDKRRGAMNDPPDATVEDFIKRATGYTADTVPEASVEDAQQDLERDKVGDVVSKSA